MSSATQTKTRWGDDLDDDEDSIVEINDNSKPSKDGSITIPPTQASRVDSKGIKLVTSYRANPANASSLIKTITKIRVTQTKVKEHVDVEKRRHWNKFGQAAIDEDQSNVTIQSRDDIYLEDPNADTDLQEEDVSKALAGNLNAFWAKQQRRQLERKYDVDPVGDESKDAAASGHGESDGWKKVGGDDDKGSNAAAGGKYIPPSARGGAGMKGGTGNSLSAMASRMGDKGPSGSSMQDNQNQNTIRVTNISEDTTEHDLQELFALYGRISRVYLAKDKETHQSRGFAFVSFVHREDAAKAMDKLQGYGYHHLILKLEWARPSAPKDPSKEGTQYRSGYGQKLAQDTKEKVSFASNLTR
mmetsp:Transcript_174/g.253  ORF Transcript_174/g.253 Transcript_174/m.253 type:complete len:358 (+) Transcript_174:77-1150(+)